MGCFFSIFHAHIDIGQPGVTPFKFGIESGQLSKKCQSIAVIVLPQSVLGFLVDGFAGRAYWLQWIFCFENYLGVFTVIRIGAGLSDLLKELA